MTEKMIRTKNGAGSFGKILLIGMFAVFFLVMAVQAYGTNDDTAAPAVGNITTLYTVAGTWTNDGTWMLNTSVVPPTNEAPSLPATVATPAKPKTPSMPAVNATQATRTSLDGNKDEAQPQPAALATPMARPPGAAADKLNQPAHNSSETPSSDVRPGTTS